MTPPIPRSLRPRSQAITAAICLVGFAVATALLPFAISNLSSASADRAAFLRTPYCNGIAYSVTTSCIVWVPATVVSSSVEGSRSRMYNVDVSVLGYPATLRAGDVCSCVYDVASPGAVASAALWKGSVVGIAIDGRTSQTSASPIRRVAWSTILMAILVATFVLVAAYTVLGWRRYRALRSVDASPRRPIADERYEHLPTFSSRALFIGIVAAPLGSMGALLTYGNVTVILATTGVGVAIGAGLMLLLRRRVLLLTPEGVAWVRSGTTRWSVRWESIQGWRIYGKGRNRTWMLATDEGPRRAPLGVLVCSAVNYPALLRLTRIAAQSSRDQPAAPELAAPPTRPDWWSPPTITT